MSAPRAAFTLSSATCYADRPGCASVEAMAGEMALAEARGLIRRNEGGCISQPLGWWAGTTVGEALAEALAGFVGGAR